MPTPKKSRKPRCRKPAPLLITIRGGRDPIRALANLISALAAQAKDQTPDQQEVPRAS